MSKVYVRQELISIPTYEIAEYDKNPMFLEKRVYQGSSGRVYPHPVCEGVADEKTDKKYKAIILENDYLFVMILPELGGRIQRLLDKSNNYDAVYYNKVVKPALVGLAGPWISGGIEFNWPQHHRPSTYDPVDYRIVENEDESITVWVGETEKMFHTKGMAGFTLYKDKAYLEIKGQLYNPTDRPQTFLWWANPAVPVNDYTKSIFPPDVNAVMDHGKRDVSKFPIADGVYYKVDYAPGTDISMYKNIPVPTSYMAAHSDFDFIGNYDFNKKAGLLHIADHHISPGKKQWTWGNGDFGKAWDRNLTDENGPYIELMTGVFTDNQPDFTFLKPYEEKSFKQYFMPYKEVGEISNACTRLVAGVDVEKKLLRLYAPSPITDGKIIVRDNLDCFEDELSLETGESKEVVISALNKNSEIIFQENGKEILAIKPLKASNEIPEPATEIPLPEELATNEELFLAATHLEQYRHATRNPEDYYLEGLKRDKTDIRLNNGYGKLLYKKGLFEEAEGYFRNAIAKSIWKNPNPYDCEPYYNLGLTLLKLKKYDEAFDAFYKATWDSNMQDKAFYEMACIKLQEPGLEATNLADEYIEKSLIKGLHNMKARLVKSIILRKQGRLEEAIEFNKKSREIDPLDFASAYELVLLGNLLKDELIQGLRDDNHNYIELSVSYIRAGQNAEALDILKLATNKNEPMVNFYSYYVSDEKEYIKKADEANSLYCFPNRLEDIEILKKAIEGGSERAKYYLGNLYYDNGRWEAAKKLWESYTEGRDKKIIPTAYRNLSLVYFNKLKNQNKARLALEKAFEMDTSDLRVLYELDQLYKLIELSSEERLRNLEKYKTVLENRDDLYIEYISLLNDIGENSKAYKLVTSHKFHPWEGGEGKVTKEYKRALLALADGEIKLGNKEAAAEKLIKALIYPQNLGEGKLIGTKDNDIYYMLGLLKEESGELVINIGKEKDMTSKVLFKLATLGDFELTSAMYYNDQPPEMMYFAMLAEAKLGNIPKAKSNFNKMIEYGNLHENDHITIDYFAVSLPDFLIFEGDLDKRNKKHCQMIRALGEEGLKAIN